MSREKSISVRFAAVGGQAVKAEMRDIGAAGRTSMQNVAGSTGAASDGLERFGLVAAQARAQLEAIASKASTSAAALRTTSDAVTSMQAQINRATGVSIPGGISAAGMLAQGQALDDQRAKYNQLFATLRQYRAEISDLKASELDGAVSSNEYAAAKGRLRTAALATIDKIKGISAAQREAAAATAEAASEAQRHAAALAAEGQRIDAQRAKYDPLYAVIRNYRNELASASQALNEGTLSADKYAAAKARLRTAALAAIDKIKGISAAQREAAAATAEAANEAQRHAAALAAEGQRIDAQRAKYDPLYAVIRNYRNELASASQALNEGTLSADKYAAAKARLRTAALAAIDKIKGLSAANREAEQSAKEAAAAIAKQAAQMDTVRAKYNPIFAVLNEYKIEQRNIRQAHTDGALSADEMKAALDRLRQSAMGQLAMVRGQTDAVEQLSRSTRGATLRMQNMFYQVNDIGVSIAGGMNPFLVMAQQGTQIAQIYGFGNGGVSGMLRDIGGMILKMPPWLKAVGGAAGFGAAGILEMRDAINKTSAVTVTFGDTAKAVFQVLFRRIVQSLRPIIDPIAAMFNWVWDRVVKATIQTAKDVVWAVQILAVGINAAVDTIQGMFRGAFLGALAEVQWAVSQMGVHLFDFLDRAATGFNSVFRTNLTGPTGLRDWAIGMGTTSNDTLAASMAPTTGTSFIDNFNRRRDALSDDPLGDFFGDVSTQAQANARRRLEDDDKGGGKTKSANAEKDAVGDLIAKLQEELLVLRETDPVKKKMLGYAKELTGATAAQRAEVERLVATLDGAEHGWEAVGRSMMDYSEQAKRQGQDLGAVFTSAFGGVEDAFAKMTETGKFEWKGLVSSMIADLARLNARQYFTGPMSAMLGGWMGGIGQQAQPLLNGVRSYDGGGNTGNGPRSGGLDGKGGFWAIMHPQETVIDRTKGGAPGGGGSMNVFVHVTSSVDPEGHLNIRHTVRQEAGALMKNSAQSQADQRYLAGGKT